MFISSSGFPHQFLQRWPGSSAALRSGAQRAEGLQEGSPPRLQCGVTAPSQDVKISKGTHVTAGLTLAPLGTLSTWHYWWVSRPKSTAVLSTLSAHGSETLA